MTTAGSIVDFDVEEGFVAIPDGIASGPDGNIWFTQADPDGGHSAVNRMTPAGVLTHFPLVPAFAGPLGIAAGSDGNLWVALNEANAIGQVTTAGALMNTFSIPTPPGRPLAITAGPDGNLWFTERAGNKIGRITPAGVITEFSIPTAASGPNDITTGFDGNLWFTEQSANKIGRITPSGAIAEFSIPTAASGLQEIAAGPAGNLWFTEQRANKIGRITTAGVISEISIPTAGAQPFGITAGPDGNIWFTELAVGKIGRLTLSSGPAAATRILPVVGSTPGVNGTFFRTSAQLNNPTGATISGRIVFHRSGVSGSASDPALSYSLSPGQTQTIADLLPAMGLSGLGSADIEAIVGSGPAVSVRVFNDAGAAGTTGFTEEPRRPDEALRSGQFGVLLLPADPTNFRFNVGLRTLAEGSAVTMTLRDASGTALATISRAFPGTYHEQQGAGAFLGVASLPAGGSIEFTPTAGAGIFYGATVDNRTGDSSFQVARSPWEY